MKNKYQQKNLTMCLILQHQTSKEKITHIFKLFTAHLIRTKIMIYSIQLLLVSIYDQYHKHTHLLEVTTN